MPDEISKAERKLQQDKLTSTYVGKVRDADTARVTLQDFMIFARPRRPLSTLKRLGTLAACAPILVLLWFALAGTLNLPRAPKLAIASAAAVPILFAALIGVLRRARRYGIDNRKSLLTEKRAPILLLRPFSDDSADDQNRANNRTVEEQLAEALKDAGPLIAVGNPRDDLPVFGGIRLYFNVAEWQEQLGRLLSISQLAIVQPGYTESVEWELNKVSEHFKNSPEHLLVSLLMLQSKPRAERERDFDIFQMGARERVKIRIPSDIGNTYFIGYDANWEPISLEPLIKDGRITADRIKSALRPHLGEALGPELEEQPSQYGRFRRLWLMVFHPKKAVEDVRRRPTWLFPLLVYAVAAGCFFILTVQPDTFLEGSQLGPVSPGLKYLFVAVLAQGFALGALMQNSLALPLSGYLTYKLLRWLGAVTTFRRIRSVGAWSMGTVALVNALVLPFVLDFQVLGATGPSFLAVILFLLSFPTWVIALNTIGLRAMDQSGRLTYPRAMIAGLLWLVLWYICLLLAVFPGVLVFRTMNLTR